MNEKNMIVTYQGSQINLYADEFNDYVNITDMANACNNRKGILSWLRSKQTIEYLNVWEKKHNPNYVGAQLSAVLDLIKSRSLTIKKWIEFTNANGIFTRMGEFAGTFAHKDIAIKFAGWLNPELELFLVEEIQRLREIENKKNSYELLNHEQILFLIRLKEVFKYVTHQTLIEEAHKDVFAAKSSSKNSFAEFNIWRNKVLDIAPEVINDRIKQYCIDNKIALTSKILNLPKREKILKLDSYESVKIAVWDFLTVEGTVNALNLANLVKDMVRTEQGEVVRSNETDLFHTKQDLGIFTNFALEISEMKMVKSAREALRQRKLHDSKNNSKNITEINTFDSGMKALLTVPPQ